MSANPGLLAIDIGSSRVKFGWFPSPGDCVSEPAPTLFPIAAPQLPQPEETLAVAHRDNPDLKAELGSWLEQLATTGSQIYAASVHPEAAEQVQQLFAGAIHVLTTDKLPIENHTEQPDRVGIDRLLNAIAANRLRQPNCAAIVVDVGTACTIDLIAADGAFEGGAILPGITLSATALHSGTAALPQLTKESFAKPPGVVGKSTQAAMTSGLYWGMVGAVRELIARISNQQTQPPQLFLTGGGAPQLVEQLTEHAELIRHIPHLVLSGIALVAEERK